MHRQNLAAGSVSLGCRHHHTQGRKEGRESWHPPKKRKREYHLQAVHPLFFLSKGNVLSEEEPYNIVEVGPNHQAEKDNHANELRTLHKLVAGLATGNYLVNQK